MATYRYTLYGKKKHTCPNCQKKTFNRYVDQQTNDFLPDHYGKCERIHSCGYELNPYKDGYHKGQKSSTFVPSAPVHREPSLIPDRIVRSYGRGGDYFSQYLIKRFGDKARKALQTYRVSTANHYGYERGTIFWQVDLEGKIRAGKVMLYDSKTGKRIKDRQNWVHKLHPDLKKTDFNMSQCLFGTHLLSLPENADKTVCIVESEKTAIIASLHYPEYVWLATGSLHNLKAESLKPLAGRKVILVPDTSLPNKKGQTAFDLWNEKANHIRLTYKIDISVSDILEAIATDAERASGYDLADYLLDKPQRLKDINWEKKSQTTIIWQADDAQLRRLRDNELTFINLSPTATGKTSTAIGYAQTLQTNAETCCFFLFPTRTLAKQVGETYHLPTLIGGEKWTDTQLFEALQADSICCLTYEYALALQQKGIFDNLIRAGVKIRAWVDEAHELEAQDAIRREAVDFIVNGLKQYAKSIEYMTGTVSITLTKSLNAPVYRSPCPTKIKMNFNALTFNTKKDQWYDALIGQLIHNDGNTIDVVRINSLKGIRELTDRLIENGLYQPSEIAVLTGKKGELSGSDEVSTAVKDHIISKERISDGIKLVLCTSVMDTGINIRNQNIHVFAVHNGKVGFEAHNLMQFLSRFREAEILDFRYILSETCAQSEGKKLAQIKSQVENLYDHKLVVYTRQAQTLTGSKVNEYLKRTPDLVNEVPKFRYDHSGMWQARTTHIGRECLTDFQKRLSLHTTVEYLNNEYQCVNSFQVTESRIKKTFYDTSAKDSQTLQAVANLAGMLQDTQQRRFLYASCLEHSDYSILADVQKIDTIFNYEFYRNEIKNSPEFLVWKQSNQETLERSSFNQRVRQFLTYMVFTNNVQVSTDWVIQYSDESQYYNQRGKIAAAVFDYLEQAGLKADYLTDPVRKQEREMQNKIWSIAKKYVGVRIKSSELSHNILTELQSTDDPWTKTITVRQVARILRAGYQIEQGGRGRQYVQLIRRFNLNDLLGIHADACKDHLRQVVQTGWTKGEKPFKDIKESLPATPPEDPLLMPETVVFGVQTSEFGYWSPEMTKKGWQKRWIETPF